MKITGWTKWDDPKYSTVTERVDRVIIQELRDKGYKFTGEYHQNGEFGVPVFDNKMVLQCSQRYWGGLMAEAYPEEIDNTNGFGYCIWAWDSPIGEMIVPNMKDYQI